MKYSAGYIRALTAFSLCYGLLYTSSEMYKEEREKHGTNFISKDLEQTFFNYRDELQNRVKAFFKEHKGVEKKVRVQTEKLLKLVMPKLMYKTLDLDLLALLLFKEIATKDKTHEDIKNLIHISELDYLLELIKDGYEEQGKGLFDRIKIAKEHIQLAKDFAVEIL